MSSPRTLGPAGWVGLIVGILAIAAGVIWLGATHDHDGKSLIENPGGVLVAVLGTLTAVISVVGPSVRRIDKAVNNNHDENLRDDLDGKHTTVIRAVEGIASDLRGVRRDIGRNSDEIAYMRRRLDTLSQHVDDLEDTINPKETP